MVGTPEPPRMKSDLGKNGFPVTLNYFTASPDVYLLENPGISVIFKSLGKKSTSTKEKSLEELISSFSKTEFHDDLRSPSFIQAWIQMYPKLAFDNSRNVRLSSQKVLSLLLKHVGGKSFSKYLKSTLPIWLLSTYDSDKSVSSQSIKFLLECFDNDKLKVDLKIWQIFSQDILHYVIVSLTMETKQTLSDERSTNESDSTAKHERVINGSLALLNKLISLINEHIDLNLDDEQFEQLEELLDNDVLWEYTTVAFNIKTLNAALANSYLVLMKSIFLEDKSNKGNQNVLCSSILSSRSLYKHICKRFFKNIKLKSSDKMSSFAYGSVILQFWGTLSVLTKFPVLDGKKKPKEGIWAIGGSKSETRLIEFLNLGHCNLDPIYFILVERLLVALVSTKSLDFQSTNLDESICKILSSSLPKLTSFAYKSTAIECLLGFIGKLPKKESLVIECFPLILEALSTSRLQRNDASNKSKCIELSAQAFPLISDSGFQKLTDAQNKHIIEFVDSGKDTVNTDVYVKLLNEVNNGERVSELVLQIINHLSEIEEEPKIKRGLETLTAVLSIDITFTNEAEDELLEFSSTIGQLLEKSTLKNVEDFIFAVWDNKQLKDKLDNFEIIDDILTKLQILSIDPSGFIKKLLNKFNYSYDDCLKSELLAEHFKALAVQPKKESDWDLLFQVPDSRVFNDVLLNLEAKDELQFISKFTGSSSSGKNIEVQPDVQNKVAHLLKLSWENYSRGKGFISFIKSTSSSSVVLHASLWSYLVELSYDDDLVLEVWSVLDQQEYEYILSRLDECLEKLPNIDKLSLALSNSLGQSIHLVEDSSEQKDTLLLGICKAFSELDKAGVREQYYCGILSQYLLDFIFTMNQDEYLSEKLLGIQSKLSSKLGRIDTTIEDVLESIINPTQESGNVVTLLGYKLDQTKGALLSYVARLLRNILDDLSVNLSPQTFDTNSNLNSLLKSPLKLAVVLSGLESLIASPKFDRIRNYVVAEILGVKSNEILTRGLECVILSISFLSGHSDFVPIPPHRLNMVIVQFEKWLDSEIAFEDSFNVMRCQLIKFLNHVDSDNKQDLINRIIEDNLSILQLQRNYELTYFTLRYLSKADASSSKEDLLDILFAEELNEIDSKNNNMAVRLCQDALERCFVKANVSEVSESQVQKLYDLVVNSKFLSLKNIAVLFLETHIQHTQQELVLKYQFKESEEEVDISLPSQLIEVLTKDPTDASEEEQLTYLICWNLLFAHFKDISYSIRNQYINQIRNTSALSHFLEFLFITLEIDNTKFVDNFDHFDSKDKVHLSLYLYWCACHYLGSEVQQWYNELRDIELKREVNKFTSNFISKLLVNSMLDEVEHGKSKFTTDVMNIKINRVINEVKSVFEIDEQTMEMVIRIPSNFPLENVTVEGPKRIGLKENQWKAWLLSSQRVISLTNGSIIEAIEVFKKNVDLHFSGFEECAICYSILHQDHSLPSKNCSTCNNKFHAACLYKWFKSSGSSTCPLCRSTFNFRK